MTEQEKTALAEQLIRMDFPILRFPVEGKPMYEYVIQEKTNYLGEDFIRVEMKLGAIIKPELIGEVINVGNLYYEIIDAFDEDIDDERIHRPAYHLRSIVPPTMF